MKKKKIDWLGFVITSFAELQNELVLLLVSSFGPYKFSCFMSGNTE